MLLIRAENIEFQPWANGGGRTRELLAWPTTTNWKVRVTLAEIERDGAFSPFPKVQRWFAVVTGQGVELRFPTGNRMVVQGDAPLCFDGKLAPHCGLLNGHTQDLNLMAREGVAAMRLVQPDIKWLEPFDQRGIFTTAAGWLYPQPAGSNGGSRMRLEPNTLLWDIAGEGIQYVPDSQHSRAWWLGYSGSVA